jgi:DNA-binding transcriptional LysR family regulator
MDEFSGILPFVHVAETRSFTVAAHRLGISPSAVSKAVTRLEGDLGTRLFTRSSRSVTLTQEGQAFFERCRRIISDMEDARQALVQAQAEPRGLLRVTVSPSFGIAEIMPLVPGILKQHPAVKIELNMSANVTDLVKEGFDVAIRIGDMPDARLVAKELAVRRLITAASPGYLSEHGTPRRPEDLSAHNCLVLLNATTGIPIDWLFDKGRMEQRTRPHGNFLTTNSSALATAAAAGVGIMQALEFNIREELADDRLVRVLEEFEMSGPKPFILFPENRRLTPKVRLFIDYMCDRLGGTV